MNSPEKTMFSKAVKDARKRRGWTQKELAERLGDTDTNTISRWERGAHVPNEAEVIKKLCDVLEMTPEGLGLLQEKPFFFLAYTQADAEFASHLKADLESQNIKIYDDLEETLDKTEHENKLRQQLQQVRAVILLASPHTGRSPAIRDELLLAQTYRCPVHVLWIAGERCRDAVPADQTVVRPVDAIDARGTRYTAALNQLVPALRKLAQQRVLLEPRNPYKGLSPFKGEDARDFFGRDDLIDRLIDEVEKLLTNEKAKDRPVRLVALVGPSGSGKSSLMMAGVIPLSPTENLF